MSRAREAAHHLPPVGGFLHVHLSPAFERLAMGKLTPLGAKPTACKCSICAHLTRLDADDTATLTGWLNDDTVPGSDLAKHLAGQTPPIRLGADAILRWRRRESACRRG